MRVDCALVRLECDALDGRQQLRAREHPPGLASESSFSQSWRARDCSPMSMRAETSQNEQIVNAPSSPENPSSVSSTL